MALQVKFKQETLYNLLKGEISPTRPVNAISFEPVLNRVKSIVNIMAYPVHYDKESNKVHKKCTETDLATDIVKAPVRAFQAEWTRPTIKNCNGVLGETNIKPDNSATYNEVDILANSIKNGSLSPNENEPIVVYGFVLFSQEQIIQVFKDTDLEIVQGRPSRHLTLQHMLIDFGLTMGRNEKKCRKCISLFAAGYLSQMIDVEATGGNNSTPVQVGQPCPPDWWFSEQLVFTAGS